MGNAGASRLGPALLGAVLHVACGGGGTTTSGAGTDSDSGPTGPGTGATDSATSTSGPTSMGTSGTGSGGSTTTTSAGSDTGTGSSGGGTDGSTGGASCPAPGDVKATVNVTPFDQQGMDWFDLVCLVEGLVTNGDTTIIDLECGGGLSMPVALEVIMVPSAPWPIAQGDLVELDYEVDQPWWTNRWITLRATTPAPEGLSPGGLVFGSMDARILEPFGVTGFFAPLLLATEFGSCEKIEDQTGCGWMERVGIQITEADSTDTFWDQTGGDLGTMASYRVAVQDAVEYSDVTCDDFAESWYRAAFLRTPEG